MLKCHTQWFLKWFQYENWATAWQNQQNDLCAQRRLRTAWASAQSDQSQCCPPEAKLGPKLPIERTAKTLIRLGECPDWPESSLGTKVILLILSSGGSKCFFLLIRVSAVRLKQTWVLSYPLSAQRRLIRLGECPGWSESSLGTEVILLFLSSGGSTCFFLESTYAARTCIHFITFFTFRIEPNMKSFSHANNTVLRRDIYIHSFNWC